MAGESRSSPSSNRLPRLAFTSNLNLIVSTALAMRAFWRVRGAEGPAVVVPQREVAVGQRLGRLLGLIQFAGVSAVTAMWWNRRSRAA